MFYTFVAKHIPVLELIVNTITHPLRMIFGAWLAGGYVPNELIALWSIGIFTGSVFRRIKEYVEGNQHARPVMKYYSIKSLIFLYFSGIFLCIILGIIFSGIVQYFAFAWGLILSVIYIGYFRSNNIRKIIEFAWR